jgi:hypothetical protein
MAGGSPQGRGASAACPCCGSASASCGTARAQRSTSCPLRKWAPYRPSSTTDGFVQEPKSASSANTPTKPAEDDRIAPVGTNYTPVTLAAPKKLRNPFEAMQARAAEPAPGPKAPAAGAGGKKLTWSERQALVKQQQAHEDAASRAAGWQGSQQVPAPAARVSTGAPAREGVNMQRVAGAAAVGGASVAAIGAAVLHHEEEAEPEPEPEEEPEPEPQVEIKPTLTADEG